MIPLAQQQYNLRRKILNLRAAQRILESPDFERAYKKATAAQYAALNVEVPSSLKNWIAIVLDDPVELWSHRRLRRTASLWNIPNYSRMSKEELIKAIHDTGLAKR